MGVCCPSSQFCGTKCPVRSDRGIVRIANRLRVGIFDATVFVRDEKQHRMPCMRFPVEIWNSLINRVNCTFRRTDSPRDLGAFSVESTVIGNQGIIIHRELVNDHVVFHSFADGTSITLTDDEWFAVVFAFRRGLVETSILATLAA